MKNTQVLQASEKMLVLSLKSYNYEFCRVDESELDFLDKEVPHSIEHHNWTHEVFPEELRNL